LRVIDTLPLSGKPEFAQSDDDRVYVNIEDRGTVARIDPARHLVTDEWKLAPGEEPTGLAIDPAHHRLFAGCGNHLLVVLDTQTGQVVATVPVGAGVDAVGFDPATQLIYAPNGADGTLSIISQDTAQNYRVVQTLETAPGARTLVVDPTSHKVYLACADFLPGEAGARPKIAPNTFRVLVCAPGPNS
jgi:DNA-binding beta-propeller fold protein YncE